jgi:hypothetical protein
MYRASVRNLQQAKSLFFGQISNKGDLHLYEIDHPVLGFAPSTILRVYLAM